VSPCLHGRCRLWFAITGCPDHQITQSLPPPGYFRAILLQTKALTKILPCATLGWPLRGPWVAQGWPKRHPNPIPGRQRVASRFRFWLIASCQLLIAQFSKNFRFYTLGRCRSVAIFFAHINSELVHGPDKPHTPEALTLHSDETRLFHAKPTWAVFIEERFIPLHVWPYPQGVVPASQPRRGVVPCRYSSIYRPKMAQSQGVSIC
jgi:hypothetical protein